ncbi:MAG: hypothetical protein N3A01_02355 [Bacteroidales bacterium]|nr:hypothetical protein [Bacteroidales bacterium]
MFTFCKKDNNIPDVSVNIALHLTDPDFITLQTIGNYVYINGGVCGIVVYRKNNEEFSAIDQCCPYKIEKKYKVWVDSTNIYLICEHCNSSYSIYDGSYISGPSKKSLKTYKTTFDQHDMILYIHN